MVGASQEFPFINTQVSQIAPPHVNNVMASYWFPREYLKIFIYYEVPSKYSK
jgi:hypothetical protein